MRFGIMFANAGPFAFPELFGTLATHAERLGFESIWTVEHVVIPVGYRSKYPYSADGKLPVAENVPLADPLLPLAYAAALTKNLRLGTGILILPQRHPVYVAKEVATLDVLSHGRMLLGIGSGWLAEEFATLGVPFEQRGARTNESIRAIRSLWKPQPEPFRGKYVAWDNVESNPKPVQQPGVPIIVGGHSEAAARRAARLGDGFFPAPVDFETLPPLLDVLRCECQLVGRDPDEIELTAGAFSLDIEQVKRYAALGVRRLLVPPPAYDAAGLVPALETLARNVVEPCSNL